MNGRPAKVLAKRRTTAPTSVAAVDHDIRHPGSSVGPRASRTITTILDATRQIFLVKGYAGTTIDEIARVAGISRGSFYTYFPSKRDVLLASGAHSLSAAKAVIASLSELGIDFDIADLQRWVAAYFALLEEHGSFSLAWTQAAQEDEEIRRAGMKSHLELCRSLGVALAALGGKRPRDPTELGLATISMFERAWSYAQLYEDTLDRTALQRTMARMLAATIETP
jgi:TetR/AcrR family transcriptional regulator